MSAGANPKSPLLWFFDAFLQERNIKWVLTAGVLILLGSSLMMVTSQWEHIGNVWKYVIFAGYFGLIHFAGQWSYRHLALRKTGTVLMGLTVLLIPVTFVAWNLFWRQSGGSLLNQAVYVALLFATGLFGVLAARRIFHHFLRGSQPTFVACYLILAFAGAVAPSIAAAGNDLYSWAASAGLWAVFLIGSIKVNRHVFWLVEHHESPRILGFFPIMLLGGQFLGLFGANFALQIEPVWMGIVCVLLAVPVLLTADAVAGVFQSRTGGIVRPLPWPIVLPLVLGILLCVTGVGLALIGVNSPTLTNAMVPTAGLAAVCMALVARRTGKLAFVWAMLAGTVLTYQASPSFFVNLVERVLDLGAQAFNEERLPYAFYGLTYLPLILATTAAAVFARRAKSTLFAPPLRHFAVGLSAVLLIASFAHPVSIYPTFVIGLLMTAVFALQAVVFRNRILVVPAILAWLVAATGAAPFAAHILVCHVAAAAVPFSLSVAAALLLVPGAWLDSLIVRLPLPARWQSRSGFGATAAQSMCQTASLTTTCVAAAVWLGGFPFMWSSPWLWPTAAMLAVLLAVHSLKWLNIGLSAYAFVFVQIAAVGYAFSLGLPGEVIISLVTLQWLTQWVVDYVMRRYPQARVSQAFAFVNRSSAFLCLSLVAAALYGPLAAGQVALPYFPFTPLWLPCFVLVGIWVFDAARRFVSPSHTVCGFLYALVLASWTLVHISGPSGWALGWLPALWAGLSLAALPVARFLQARLAAPGSPGSARDAGIRAIAVPLEHTIQAVLAVAAVGSLMVFTWPMRVAGGIALVGLIAAAKGVRAPRVRTLSLALVNWQLVCVVVQVFCGAGVKHCLDLSVAGILPVCLPVAVLAAASLFVWQRGFGENDDVAKFQRVMLRVFAFGAILFTLQQLPAGWQGGLGIHGVALAVIAFTALACSEFFTAQKKNIEHRVWSGELIIAAAVGYLVAFGLITFDRGISMLAVLGAGLAAYAGGRLCDMRETTRVFVHPFVRTALVLPLVTVGIGLYRYFFYENPTVLGLNSLALMLTAGFYFYVGVERKQKWPVVLAAAVANIALSLLWLELAWSDPQFFMIPLGVSVLLLVELLRAEIPAEMRDPLRYAGALVILVSPMYHVFDGSWLHLLTWMVASVGVLLLAIGLRVRALVYTGTAFLVADLVGMVVRGSVDHPNLLWLAGVVFGAAVVTLGAICENNRERVLQRMRTISARLETWN